MNKQEAIEIIEQSRIKIANREKVIFKAGETVAETEWVDYVPLEVVVNTINQIHEPQKVAVPKVALEYYETYKNSFSSFGDWFEDLWPITDKRSKEYELAKWLYEFVDNSDEQRKRELALATLIANGPDAVEVEKEKLYIVEFPTGQQLYKNYPSGSSKEQIVIKFANPKDKDGHFIKRELEEAGFGWVFDCSGVKVVEVE